jgi:hypothetical protein
MQQSERIWQRLRRGARSAFLKRLCVSLYLCLSVFICGLKILGALAVELWKQLFTILLNITMKITL